MIRASGLVAITSLVLLMISGIGHVTGWTYEFLAPVKAWAVHKAIAFVLLASIGLHLFGLLIDHYVRFTFLQELIPFAKNYSNGSRLWGFGFTPVAIASGIFALYGVLIVTLSSLDSVGWIRDHKKLWQIIHVSSYLTMVLVFVHVLGAGTDFKESSWRLLVVLTAGLLLVAGVLRLLRSGFMNKNGNN